MTVTHTNPQLALIAHDQKKPALVEFTKRHRAILKTFRIVATGTTGHQLQKACPELNIATVQSGPLGGDQQIGALITEQKIQALIFFIDPLSALPHDVDVKALMRLAVVHNIALALNEATAELLITCYPPA